MKGLGPRDLLEAIIFLTPKKLWKSPQKQTYSAAGALSSHFEIKPRLLCCLLFIIEYLNPQVRRRIKWQTRIVLIKHRTSGLTSRIHPLIFPYSLDPTYLSRIFLESCIKNVYLSMFGNNFQICGVLITGKCILQLRQPEVDILLMPPQAKLSQLLFITDKALPRVLFIQTRRKLLTPPPYAAFVSKISFIKRRTSLSFARYMLN